MVDTPPTIQDIDQNNPDVIEQLESKFGKNWSEFTQAEKEEAVQITIDTKGSVDEALRHPLIMRFFFEINGPQKWGEPDFAKK